MSPVDTSFHLGGWLVQPQLNRLTRSDGTAVQIEPKMMDVLVCLARQPGAVIPREQLIDAVWPKLFISDSVLTRAIAGLRRALEDDARRPIFIETISKRGYRLLATPTPAADAVQVRPGGPYVVGQWVRAESFYGREAQLHEVLHGPRNGFWVVGTRRRGKTSFLKQLEHLVEERASSRLVPVFWDLEGTDDNEALAFSFEEALADAEQRLAAAGVAIGEIIDADLFRMLGALRRRLQARERILLLLCDEVEELIGLAARSEVTVRRLRRSLLAHGGMRSVLASGPRLWNLAGGTETSPFLDGFLPPLYLGSLGPATARALVQQSQLADGIRPELSTADVDAICRWGGGHPFLLQLLSKRVIEHGDVERGVAEVAADRSVTSLFEVDMELLDGGQRSLLVELAKSREGAIRARGDSQSLLELDHLGLIATDGRGRTRVAVPLFREWLSRR